MSDENIYIPKEEIDKGIAEVVAELESAVVEHGWFASRHEAWGVIAEEWGEVKAEIWADGPAIDLRKEAIQLAAMALELAVQFGKEGGHA